MFTIRDVIADAYARCGIWPNSTDALPGEYVNQGELLLKGIISELNLSNYLAFTRKTIKFDITKESMIIGEDYLVDGEVIIATDVVMPKFTKINKVYNRSTGSNDYPVEMSFVSDEEFEGYPNTADYYSWLQVDDIQGKILFKPTAIGNAISVHYNEAFDINLDSEVRLPDIYRQLWTLGLVVEIMKDWPKTDNTQLTVYQSSYTTLKNSLTAKMAENKVRTNLKRYSDTFSEFMSGSYLER